LGEEVIKDRIEKLESIIKMETKSIETLIKKGLGVKDGGLVKEDMELYLISESQNPNPQPLTPNP
jgi:hypothetical protein